MCRMELGWFVWVKKINQRYNFSENPNIYFAQDDQINRFMNFEVFGNAWKPSNLVKQSH